MNNTFTFTPEVLASEHGAAHGQLAFGQVFHKDDAALRRDAHGDLRLVQQWGGSMNIRVTGDVSALAVGVPVELTPIPFEPLDKGCTEPHRNDLPTPNAEKGPI